MINTEPITAELLYSEGMKYDLADKSPADATVARACFQQAATMGHLKACRALAHMTFDGSGGDQDKESALLFLWQAFRQGDFDALEELADMLESYAETAREPSLKKYSGQTACRLTEINDQLQRVSSFMEDLKRNCFSR